MLLGDEAGKKCGRISSSPGIAPWLLLPLGQCSLHILRARTERHSQVMGWSMPARSSGVMRPRSHATRQKSSMVPLKVGVC